jgi:hypothetical protein
MRMHLPGVPCLPYVLCVVFASGRGWSMEGTGKSRSNTCLLEGSKSNPTPIGSRQLLSSDLEEMTAGRQIPDPRS